MSTQFRFFSAKRKNGATILSLRGKQIASVWKQGDKFVASRADIYGFEDGFDTAAIAEEFVWRNWV